MTTPNPLDPRTPSARPGTEHAELVLPPCGESGCLWSAQDQRVNAIKISDDTYRIAEVPIDSTDVGYGDVVLALPFDGSVEFVTVLERRCIASVSFVLPGWLRTTNFLAELARLGVHCRDLGNRAVICNVDDVDIARGAVDLLDQHRVRALYCDHESFRWHEIGG